MAVQWILLAVFLLSPEEAAANGDCNAYRVEVGVADSNNTAVAEAVLDALGPLLREALTAVRSNLTRIEDQVNSLSESLADIAGTVNGLSGSVYTAVTEHSAAINNHVNERIEGVTEKFHQSIAALAERFDVKIAQLKGDLSEKIESGSSSPEAELCSVNENLNEALLAISETVSSLSSEIVAEGQETRDKIGTVLQQLAVDIIRELHVKERAIITSQNVETAKIKLALTTSADELFSDIDNELQNTADYIFSHLENTYECGGTDGWRRVVHLDMTDPNTNCPSGWQLITKFSKRTCGLVNSSSLSCDSATFPVPGGASYGRVCGSIRAYQDGPTDAFAAYNFGNVSYIDEAYVTGVSVTHGTPRQHIWTFAAGATEMDPYDTKSCPCDAEVSISTPPYVGRDYFCESGANAGPSNWFHLTDPLWDGQGCTTASTCCEFSNPPYFTKELPSSTSDSIEARLCGGSSRDSTPVEFIELYVM